MTAKRIDPDGKNLDSDLEKALNGEAEVVDLNAETQKVEYPIKSKEDVDSLEDLSKQGIVVANGKKKEEADTRVFKIGSAPIGKFFGSESPEFAIMRLIEKTNHYTEQRGLIETDREREVEAIGILKSAIPEYEKKAFEIIAAENCPVFELLDKARYDSKVLDTYFSQEEAKKVLAAMKAKTLEKERGFAVGDVLELMLLRIEVQGEKVSLVDAVETTSKGENGEVVKRKEVYGNNKTAPYKVVMQKIAGQGERMWVVPAFPETMNYHECLGSHFNVVKVNGQNVSLTPEDKNKLTVYAQLHQQGVEEDFEILRNGIKHRSIRKGETAYATKGEELDAALDAWFTKSETPTPVKLSKPASDPNSETRRVERRPTTRIEDDFSFGSFGSPQK